MRRALGAAAVVVATVSLGLVLVGWWHSQPARIEARAAEPTIPATSRPVDSAPPAGPSSPAVALSAPERIAIPELDFELAVDGESLEEMAVAYNRTHPRADVARAIYASDFYKAAWPTNYGSRPGMSSPNTAYLTCHSSAIRRLPCNALAAKGAVRPGFRLVVTTATAEVSYVVEKLLLVKKSDFAGNEEVRRQRPGWAVLTVCLLQDGRRTDYSWAIFARAVQERAR